MTELGKMFKAQAGFSPKEKYVIPKPEHLLLQTTYAFSFNPIDDSKMDFSDLTSWSKDFLRIFDNCFSCDIRLYVEYSTHAKFHFHGYIKIKDELYFYLKDLPYLKGLGTFEIDTIGDPMYWDMYCKKNKGKMKRLCQENGLIYIFENTRLRYKK